MEKDNVFVMIVFFIVLWWILPNYKSEQPIRKDFYFEVCGDYKTDISDCKEKTIYINDYYLIFIKEQFVVEKGGSSYGAIKYSDCEIFDEDNWHCNIKDDNGKLLDEVSVHNGNYTASFSHNQRKSLDKNGKETSYPLYVQRHYYHLYLWHEMNLFFNLLF